MAFKSVLRRILLGVGLIALIASPCLLRAQQKASEGLREQAAKLQQDIEALKKSKADLSGRISASLLSSLESEIQAKQTALDSTQQNVKQAEALERDIADLTTMLDKMHDRISADLVSKLDLEIRLKHQSLLALSSGGASPDPPAVPTEGTQSPSLNRAPAPTTSDPDAKADPDPALGGQTSTPAKVENPKASEGQQPQPEKPSPTGAGAKGGSGGGGGGSVKGGGGGGDKAGEGSGSGSKATGEWESRAIVGYHQAGASSASFTQNFFFDFFVARALSAQPLHLAPVNLWGDVRIASAPQQINSPISTFVTGFAGQISKLPVNQLAQAADFQSGLEFRRHGWGWNRGDTYRTIGLVSYFGALGTFQPPSNSVQIFDVPSTQSPQYSLFAQEYPTAANSKYVGFAPPDRNRFYRQYGLGFRVTTFDQKTPLNPPGMFLFGVGQDESVTGGVFRSIVGRFDVFYPLPLPSTANKLYRFVYLFGTANLRFSRATNLQPLVLQNPNATSVTVNGYDPDVAIVTVRSNRDTYRIGVGVDLMSLIQSKASPPKKDSSK